MRLALVDPVAPKPYTFREQTLAGLGGTEMTVAAVLGRLAARQGMRVEVMQSARDVTAVEAGARFSPFRWKCQIAADTIIVINSWKAALACRKANPDARIYLWLHVFPGRHNRRMGRALADAEVDVICVSASHAKAFRKFAGPEVPSVGHIPNPIADDLRPGTGEVDPTLLLFASAPHKGLTEVFGHFRRLRSRLPEMRLAVADPGYMKWCSGPIPEGVIMIGRQSKPRLLRIMERSLCLFYPQTSFAETFGIVLAEANAVGCPALVHAGLGANDEVVSTPDQCIDCAGEEAVIARIEAWRRERPRVSGRSEYRLSAVVERWMELLGVSGPESSQLSETAKAA